VSVVAIATLPSAKTVAKARIEMRDIVVPFVLSLTRIPPLVSLTIGSMNSG